MDTLSISPPVPAAPQLHKKQVDPSASPTLIHLFNKYVRRLAMCKTSARYGPAQIKASPREFIVQDKRHLRNSLYMYIVKTTYAAPRKSDLDGRCKGWQKPAFLENLLCREAVSIVQAGSCPLASGGPVTTQARSGPRSVNSGPEKEPHTGLWGPACKSPLGAPPLSAQAGCSGNMATAESGKRGKSSFPQERVVKH